MTRTTRWFIPLAAALLLVAGLASAQKQGGGELVLFDEDGQEVLRLAPDQLTTGLQTVPAGKYRLEVHGPGPFKLLLEEDTELEFKQPIPPPEETVMQMEEDSPVVIDFDLEAGDQHMRLAPVGGPGEKVELQLTGFGLPEFYGWSAVIEYDPEQLELVSNSFRPSSFVPSMIPLVDSQEGRVEVGGANFSKVTVSGDGDLGQLAFETLDGFSGEAELKLVEVKLRKLEGTDVIQTEMRGIISSEPPPEGGDAQHRMAKMAVLGGQEAIDKLLDERACPGCDLSGANLMQKDLEGVDLTGANLKGANLFRAKLGMAKLEGAILTGANLLQADMHKAKLAEADLSEARLTGAKLQEADLTDAILEEAKLTGANMTGATWIDGSKCGQGSVGQCKGGGF